ATSSLRTEAATASAIPAVSAVWAQSDSRITEAPCEIPARRFSHFRGGHRGHDCNGRMAVDSLGKCATVELLTVSTNRGTPSEKVTLIYEAIRTSDPKGTLIRSALTNACS